MMIGWYWPTAPGLRALDCGSFLHGKKVTKDPLKERRAAMLRRSFAPARHRQSPPLKNPFSSFKDRGVAIRSCVVSVLRPVIDAGLSEVLCDRLVVL